MDKGCHNCFHEYHCPMPQEGYDYNPDTCKYNPDNERKKPMTSYEKLKAILAEIDSYEKKIFDFKNDFYPMNGNVKPKEDGYYVTIRCGLGGIYTNLNEWKDGHWQTEMLDGGQIIAFSKKPVVLETLKLFGED